MLGDLLNRLRWFFGRTRAEKEMDEELRVHIESRAEDLQRSGLTREEAHRHARIEFGGHERYKEECREAQGTQFVDTLLQDLRYGLRTLRKSPGFTAVAVWTLALGIGANTAIFSVVEGIILSPLPFAHPNQLVIVGLYNRTLKYWTALSYPDFQDWQQNSRSFEQIAAFKAQGFDITNGGSPEHVDGLEVSSNFFRTLRGKLMLGREFMRGEDKPAAMPAAIISNRLWRERFAGNPSELGKGITLNGEDYTIVGVLEAGFRFDLQPADVYTTLGREPSMLLTDRTIHDILCVARLRPEVNVDQAQSELNIVQEHIDDLNPATERGLGTYVVPLKQLLIGDLRETLVLLFGAVGLVLLIACANMANLMLGRSAGRAREFAVRKALGAGRGQIVRQLVTESMLLALGGAVLGLILANWSLAAARATVLRIFAENVPRSENIRVNTWVLLFAFGVSMAVGIAFGILPALKSAKTDLQSVLKQGGRGSRGGASPVQRVLVAVQIALALVLLIGGSLLFRTMQNLWAVNPGFDTRNVVTFQVGLSPSSIDTPAKIRTAYQQFADRIRQIQGVEAADITALVPMGQGANEGPFWVGTRQPASMAEIPRAIYYPTGPDYVGAMKIPLLRGRFLSEADTLDREPVILIDSLLAQTYFPDRDAVGQSLTIPHWGESRNVSIRIVGVVGHVKHYGLDGAVGEKPQIYYSLYQLPDQWLPLFRPEINFAIRTQLNQAALLPAIKDAVRDAGGEQTIYNVHTMQDLVRGSMGRQRFPMLLLAGFAIVALLLASVGVYGVISYSVTQRVKEIGIRMALGAERRNVFRMVVGQGLRLTLAGLAAGAASALALTRLLTSFSRLLYGVAPADPFTFVGVSVILTGVAVLACWIPARRATRVDPLVALRYE